MSEDERQEVDETQPDEGSDEARLHAMGDGAPEGEHESEGDGAPEGEHEDEEIDVEAAADRIAARGREALVLRLRPAFKEAAAAHADLLDLTDEQIEEMVQRAADGADGLQWRRALAWVATEELQLSLGEALGHPAVARAQQLLGAPSYEESLAALTARVETAQKEAGETAHNRAQSAAGASGAAVNESESGPSAPVVEPWEREAAGWELGVQARRTEGPDEQAEGDRPAEAEAQQAAAAEAGDAEAEVDKAEEVALEGVQADIEDPGERDRKTELAPQRRGGDAQLDDDHVPSRLRALEHFEADEEDEEEEEELDELRIAAIHLGGIANLSDAEPEVELCLARPGLDIIRASGEVLGRLEWEQIEVLEVPEPRRRLRRSTPTHLVIRTARGDASFEVPGVEAQELRDHLAPISALYLPPAPE